MVSKTAEPLLSLFLCSLLYHAFCLSSNGNRIRAKNILIIAGRWAGRRGGNTMTYERMPLFPPPCGSRSSLQLPLFDPCACAADNACQCVRVRNPYCPTEYADVELCVDAGGNLSICVHRPPQNCRPPRRKNKCGCRELPPWYR